jgi:DNA-binding transcriptional ArsR family regulator
MTTEALDLLIHVPARLRIVATLAALPDGDALSLTRLGEMTGLTPGQLPAHLRELENAGYARTGTSAGTIALTRHGRGALEHYASVLRHPATRPARQDQGPGVRIGDADRDAMAAALGEHFARGRLTLDELDARLDVIFAATTYGEVSQATRDLPDVTVLLVTCPHGPRPRRGHRPGRASQGTSQGRSQGTSQGTRPRHRGPARGGYS